MRIVEIAENLAGIEIAGHVGINPALCQVLGQRWANNSTPLRGQSSQALQKVGDRSARVERRIRRRHVSSSGSTSSASESSSTSSSSSTRSRGGKTRRKRRRRRLITAGMSRFLQGVPSCCEAVHQACGKGGNWLGSAAEPFS